MTVAAAVVVVAAAGEVVVVVVVVAVALAAAAAIQPLRGGTPFVTFCDLEVGGPAREQTV